MASNYAVFAAIGLILIALGVLALLIPLLLESEILGWLEKIPPIIVYVYRRNGFTFVTSPILIVVGALYLLYRWLVGFKGS